MKTLTRFVQIGCVLGRHVAWLTLARIRLIHPRITPAARASYVAGVLVRAMP